MAAVAVNNTSIFFFSRFWGAKKARKRGGTGAVAVYPSKTSRNDLLDASSSLGGVAKKASVGHINRHSPVSATDTEEHSRFSQHENTNALVADDEMTGTNTHPTRKYGVLVFGAGYAAYHAAHAYISQHGKRTLGHMAVIGFGDSADCLFEPNKMDWYSHNGVDLFLDMVVTEIHTHAKLIITHTGLKFRAEKALIIASGCRPILLDDSGAFTAAQANRKQEHEQANQPQLNLFQSNNGASSAPDTTTPQNTFSTATLRGKQSNSNTDQQPDLFGMFYVRGGGTIGDERIVKVIARASTAVRGVNTGIVLGDTVEALVSAGMLVSRGLNSIVVIPHNRLMKYYCSPTLSLVYEKYFESRGIQIIKDQTCTGVMGAERVTGVQLQNGRSIPASFLLVALGRVPHIELVKTQLQLQPNSQHPGILVNEHLMSSVPGVYVVGEAAAFPFHMYTASQLQQPQHIKSTAAHVITHLLFQAANNPNSFTEESAVASGRGGGTKARQNSQSIKLQPHNKSSSFKEKDSNISGNSATINPNNNHHHSNSTSDALSPTTSNFTVLEPTPIITQTAPPNAPSTPNTPLNAHHQRNSGGSGNGAGALPPIPRTSILRKISLTASNKLPRRKSGFNNNNNNNNDDDTQQSDQTQRHHTLVPLRAYEFHPLMSCRAIGLNWSFVGETMADHVITFLEQQQQTPQPQQLGLALSRSYSSVATLPLATPHEYHNRTQPNSNANQKPNQFKTPAPQQPSFGRSLTAVPTSTGNIDYVRGNSNNGGYTANVPEEPHPTETTDPTPARLPMIVLHSYSVDVQQQLKPHAIPVINAQIAKAQIFATDNDHDDSMTNRLHSSRGVGGGTANNKAAFGIRGRNGSLSSLTPNISATQPPSPHSPNVVKKGSNTTTSNGPCVVELWLYERKLQGVFVDGASEMDVQMLWQATAQQVDLDLEHVTTKCETCVDVIGYIREVFMSGKAVLTKMGQAALAGDGYVL